MHIFISYAKKDTRNLALRIQENLNSLPSITAWMDDSLQPASSWASQIEYEIDRCDYFLVLLSPDVNRARTERQAQSFVLKEINYAQAQHKRMIVVMAKNTKLPLQLADEQFIDFTRNPEDGMKRVVNFLLKQVDVTPVHLPKYSDSQVIKRPSIEETKNVSEPQASIVTANPLTWISLLNWGGRMGLGLSVLLIIVIFIAIFASPEPTIYLTGGNVIAYTIIFAGFGAVFVGIGQFIAYLINSTFRIESLSRFSSFPPFSLLGRWWNWLNWSGKLGFILMLGYSFDFQRGLMASINQTGQNQNLSANICGGVLAVIFILGIFQLFGSVVNTIFRRLLGK